MDPKVIGTVIGATAVLLLVRFAVPEPIKDDPKWAPVLVLALVVGAFAGLWVGSVFA